MFCIIRQNAFVPEDFDHQNMIIVQNKSDIRNQHQKLHLMTKFFIQKNSLQNSTVSYQAAIFYLILACNVPQLEFWSEFLDKKIGH